MWFYDSIVAISAVIQGFVYANWFKCGILIGASTSYSSSADQCEFSSIHTDN